MIDLHAHSTISDGTMTPKELVNHAKAVGLTAVALTDHDSIDGLKEAKREADRIGLTFVKGIEFSAMYREGRQFHILGLGIEPNCEAFMKPFRAYKQSREENVEYVFEQLRAMDVVIDRVAVQPYMVNAYMDRQAIAKYLVGAGYAPIMKKAWVNYLDKIPNMEGELTNPKDAIDMIHAAGGKAFLAHFHIFIGMKGYTEEEADRYMAWLKELGLDGLECYYPAFTEQERQRAMMYAKKYDFLISGGSDFHGSNRAHIALGTGEGDFAVPDELLDHIVNK